MPRKVFFSFHYDDVNRTNVVRNSDVITRQYQTGVRFYDKSLWEEAEKQGYYAIKRMIDGALEGSSVTCVLIGQKTWQRPWVRYELVKSLARSNGLLGIHIHNVGFDPRDRGTFGSGLDPSPIAWAFMEHLQPTVPPPAPSQGILGAFATRPLGVGLLSEEPPLASGLLGVLRQPSRPNPLDAGLAGAFLSPTPAPQPGRNPFAELGYGFEPGTGVVTFYERGETGQWQRFSKLSTAYLSDVPLLRNRPHVGTFDSLFPIYGWHQNDGLRNFPEWIETAATVARR